MVLSQENHRKLASVIVASANNADAIALNKALAACLYDYPLFVDAVSRATANSGNETIYKLVRMGLDLESWKKIAEKAGDKNVYQMMLDTRRSSANGVSSPGGVVFTNLITDRTGTAAAAGTVTISLHDVMNGMVTINDTAAVSVPGSGKLVGASTTSSNVTFCDKRDLNGLTSAVRPNCTKFTGHFTHAKSVNASSASGGEGISYIKNCLLPCTVRGFRQLTSAAENLKFDYYYAGITESQLNQVWGYHASFPEMPSTRDLTSHSSLRFLVRNAAAATTATAANAGVVGNGWFTSVFENSSDADIDTNYQGKTDGTNKTEAETTDSYSNGEFYSGYPEASDIANGLSKEWNATRLVALGLEYRDIQNAGFPINLSDFSVNKTPGRFLLDVMGYTVASGKYTYKTETVTALQVLRDLKAGGYSLADLKNDADATEGTLAFLKKYDDDAGSTFAHVDDVYPNEMSAKDRFTQFDNYTSVAGAFNSTNTLLVDAATYPKRAIQYVQPVLKQFGKMSAKEMVDVLVELDAANIQITLPTLSTGGVWPNTWTRREQIEAMFCLQTQATTGGTGLLIRYLNAIAQINDMDGLSKMIQKFAYWDVPANFNARNSSDLKFRAAIAAYASSNLPTDDFYGLFGAGYQQYVYELAGEQNPLISGMNWEKYYKSDAGHQPHQLYNKFLNVNGVPASAKASIVIPNTDTAVTWTTIAVTADLSPALTNAGHGWPLTNGTGSENPWGSSVTTLGQDIGSKWIDAGTDEVATMNMHLLLSSHGYNMSLVEFLQSPALSTETGPVNSDGLLQFKSDLNDDATGRVLNVLLYTLDANAPSFNILKQLIVLENERIAEIFKETAADTATGAGVLNATQRAGVITAAFNRDNTLGNQLFDMLKANSHTGESLDIGVVLVKHLISSSGGNVPSTAFDVNTFLAAESAIVDMKQQITKYPGQLWAAIQDETTTATEENLEEVFVSAYLRLSDSEKAEFFAEAKKWNENPARIAADMINSVTLGSVVMPVYAKQETLPNGLVANYESASAKLPPSELTKIKAALGR